MPATLDDLFNEAKLPASMCASYRPEDCAGPLEWCCDGKLRCDVHADSSNVTEPLCEHCGIAHDVDFCANCGVPIELDSIGWNHAEVSPEGTPCWSGDKGAMPGCKPVRRPLRETRPL